MWLWLEAAAAAAAAAAAVSLPAGCTARRTSTRDAMVATPALACLACGLQVVQLPVLRARLLISFTLHASKNFTKYLHDGARKAARWPWTGGSAWGTAREHRRSRFFKILFGIWLPVQPEGKLNNVLFSFFFSSSLFLSTYM